MDNDIDFVLDEYQEPEVQTPPQDDEPPAEETVETLKAKLAERDAKLGQVGFIVEELDKNPGKLYDIKAALVGQPPQQTVQYQQQQYQQPQQPQVDRQAQIAQIKEQFNKKFLVEGDPFEAMMGVVLPLVQNSQQQTALQMGSSTASIVVNNFIAAKRSADADFAKVEPYFAQRINLIPQQQLAQMSADMINQTLAVAYDAAWGQLAQEARQRSAAKAAAQSQRISQPAPSYGGGGRADGGGRQAAPTTDFSKEERELAKALGLSPEDLKEN